MDESQGDKVYTLAGAAAAAGVSLPTIRRREAELLAAGAVKTAKRWEIPHSALVAVGFTPDWTTDDVQQPQEAVAEPIEVEPVEPPARELQDAKDRIRRLESENTILRHHVDHWQLIARERLDSLNAERVALHALTLMQPKEIEATKEPAEEPRPRESWWRRNFG